MPIVFKPVYAYRKWKFKRKVKQAHSIIKNIDFVLQDYPKWYRKQFWRDFIKSPKFRHRMLESIYGGSDDRIKKKGEPGEKREEKINK